MFKKIGCIFIAAILLGMVVLGYYVQSAFTDVKSKEIESNERMHDVSAWVTNTKNHLNHDAEMTRIATDATVAIAQAELQAETAQYDSGQITQRVGINAERDMYISDNETHRDIKISNNETGVTNAQLSMFALLAILIVALTVPIVLRKNNSLESQGSARNTTRRPSTGRSSGTAVARRSSGKPSKQSNGRGRGRGTTRSSNVIQLNERQYEVR